MAYRPPNSSTYISSTHTSLARAFSRPLCKAESLASRSKAVQILVPSKIWTLTSLLTLGLLTGDLVFSKSMEPAMAHPLFQGSELTAHAHIPISDGSSDLPSISPTFQQQTNTDNPSPSPWGDPYTGNGTSTDARGSCPGVNTPLVALMPDINSGRSLSSYPTLWFYVPYNSETISRGTFLLQDKGHNDVMEPIDFTLSNTPGFVSVTLPPSAPPLKLNEPYHWYFELFCQDNHRSSVSVDGWIEKASLDTIDPNLAIPPSPIREDLSPPTQANSFSHYPVYRQNFIWFDAVDSIIQEWSEMPDVDLATELLSLFQSANVQIEEWPSDTVLTPVVYD